MNNPYRSGTADVWYSGPDNDLWVEYKWLPRLPKRHICIVEGANPMLSHLQQKWLNALYDERRNVAVVLGTPAGGIILKDKNWMLPFSFDTLLTKAEVAEWISKETHYANHKNTTDSSSNNVSDV